MEKTYKKEIDLKFHGTNIFWVHLLGVCVSSVRHSSKTGSWKFERNVICLKMGERERL